MMRGVRCFEYLLGLGEAFSWKLVCGKGGLQADRRGVKETGKNDKTRICVCGELGDIR